MRDNTPRIAEKVCAPAIAIAFISRESRNQFVYYVFSGGPLCKTKGRVATPVVT